MFGMLFRSSTKMAATFVVLIGLMLLCFMFAPGLLTGLQDVAEWLDNYLRTPPLNQQETVLWRTLVNENTLFGVISTIIARMVVELGAFFFGTVLGFSNKDSRDLF